MVQLTFSKGSQACCSYKKANPQENILGDKLYKSKLNLSSSASTGFDILPSPYFIPLDKIELPEINQPIKMIFNKHNGSRHICTHDIIK